MLRVDQVSRTFGQFKAVDGVTFEVGPGRLTGFVGGNGAGKTTTMRIIMGVLAADAGSVSLNGKPVTRPVAATFGYMPEERGLYPKTPVGEQLVYLARLHGVNRAQAEENVADLLERLGLTARVNDRLEKLSLGNQQRAQIAAALVHDPTVLILDEPFSGLDPLAVDTVMAVLRERAARGVPVLFSSHQLDVVERITDDLVIISGGQIKASGATAALQEQYAGSRYRLEAADTAWVAGLPGVTAVVADGAGVTFDAPAELAQQVLQQALGKGPVVGFNRVIPSLAEVFREVVGDAPKADEADAAPAAKKRRGRFGRKEAVK
ncbi:MAG: ATP-binding cassette domain-containing protein [Bifidobacteriaceae bacterium]|jgi:ABC-2 type transport system ATP-binding protein|nr:ATP-binding cassette domain-containing protein [Bifidobacteriaceae bacterium]